MRLTERVHRELDSRVKSGDYVIDATAGNGHDSLKLAQLVGSDGEVFIVDIQGAAIDATRLMLSSAELEARCKLVCGDHGLLLTQCLGSLREQVSVITFNLGYFPGGDKSITTLPVSTIQALDASKGLLQQGGALFVTAYRGHSGGLKEAASVECWMKALFPNEWSVSSSEPEVSNNRIPPILWIAVKL